MSSLAVDNVLKVKGLHVRLGGQPILSNIDLTVAQGTIHALLGPNGAGKTTLMRCLTGSIPFKGEIQFKFSGSGRIGYVPQLLEFDHSLPLTVADFLMIMQQKKPVVFNRSKKIYKEVLSCLKKTASEHLANRMIGGLSGGELRRVLLAQALSPTPEILLLDEPASNIDEVGARAFEETLVDLRDQHGIAIIMVGHDLHTISRIADHATGIQGGITWSGPAKGLLEPDVLQKIFGVQMVELAGNKEMIG